MFRYFLKRLDYEKAGLNESVKVFSVGFYPIDTNDILDIQKYLIKKCNIRQCLS